MLTIQEARERVARGAALLDEKRPGWANQIDVGSLQLSSCVTCVLGQLSGDCEEVSGYGRFFWGMLHRFRWSFRDAIDFGFASPESSKGYVVLTSAWLDAIADRTVPARFPITKPVETPATVVA